MKFGSFSAHYLWQRITAVLLVFLVPWSIFHIVVLLKDSTYGVTDFLISPINIALLLIFIALFLYHGFLGIDNVFKDYVSCKQGASFLSRVVAIICVFIYVLTVLNLLFYHFMYRLIAILN